MSERTVSALTQAPMWVVAEMPPGYATRLAEIERLSTELDVMDGIGGVLWETGYRLRDAVCGVLGALRCEVNATPGSNEPIAVKLDESRRLLFVVSASADTIQKTDEELTRAFQAVQFAEADDRVVLVANNAPATAPADRPDPVAGDALSVLEKMGVSVVSAVTLFRLWRLSLVDEQKARSVLDRLHAQNGGPFVIQAR